MTTNKNDGKIKELILKVEEQKQALGSRPKFILKTNGIFKYDEKKFFNLNVAHEKTLVEALAFLYIKKDYTNKACSELGVNFYKFEWDGYTLDEWKDDFKSHINLVKWEEKKKLLDATQKKLDSLVSEEVKTELELDNIAKLLG